MWGPCHGLAFEWPRMAHGMAAMHGWIAWPAVRGWLRGLLVAVDLGWTDANMGWTTASMVDKLLHGLLTWLASYYMAHHARVA